MKRTKKSKNLVETERRYFAYCLISCIGIFLLGLLLLEIIFVIFDAGAGTRLFLYCLDFLFAAYGSYRIGKTNWIRKLIDAIHQ